MKGFGYKVGRAVRSLARIALAALCPVVLAAGESEPALSDLSLQQLLEVEVISASRIVDPRETAPSTIWVVTREQIERLGLRDLKDILALGPGVDAIDPHFFLLGGQRGFVGSFSQALLLVDGREMNNLIAGESFISNQFRAQNIERVEIVNGPGSALYGANALAGVINIITRTGSGFRGLDTQLAVASFGTAEANVIAGSDREDALDIRAAISWIETDGDDFSEFLSDTSRASPAAENNAYRHLPNQYGYSSTSEALFVSLLAERGRFYSGAHFYRNDSGRGTSGIQWDYTGGSDHRDLLLSFIGFRRDDLLGKRLRLRAEYRYYREQFWGDHTETEGALVDPATGDEITSGATRDDVERFRGYYSNHDGPGATRHVAAIDATMCTSETSTLVGGVTWELADVVAARFARGEGTHPALGPDQMRPEYSNYKYGIYLQDQVRFLSGRLIATVGFRYDAHERYDDSYNPRAGLVYRPTGKTTLRLSYGEAFREPNVFELQNSESIRPTDLATWEVAWRQSLGSNFSNEIVAFQNRADDLIVTDEVAARGILNKEKINTERLQGKPLI